MARRLTDMRALPLYSPDRRAAVEREAPLDCDGVGLGSDCTRCALCKRARSVCLSADGEPGGFLIVGEAPGRDEDSVGRPFVGRSGALLRKEVEKVYDGPVVYDNAVRCFPAKSKLDKPIRECRGYLAQTIVEVAPKRIITLGATAAKSVLGRAVAPFSNRRSFSFLGDGTPVMIVIHPAAALRNRFVRKWFASDLAWALTVDDADIPRPRFGSRYRLVCNEDDANWAVTYMRDKLVAFDVEATGFQWGEAYNVFAVALCARGDHEPVVWPEQALRNPATLKPLLDYLADPRAFKGGQSVKYDVQAVMSCFGTTPRGIVFDTKLMRKLLDPEADASLDKMSELVGHGGCKEEAHDARANVVKAVQMGIASEAKLRRAVEWRRVHGDAKTIVVGDKRERRPPFSATDKARCEALEDLEDEHPELVSFARAHPDEKPKWDFGLIDREVLNRYNARDALTTSELAAAFDAELDAQPNLRRTYNAIVNDAGLAAAQIEAWGIAIDRDAVLAFDSYLAMVQSEAQARLDAQAPGCNWNSPQQVGALLFDKLGLPKGKITDAGNASTDKDVLEGLKHLHQIPADLLAYRAVDKLRTTYAKGMLPHIRPDGRIHGSLNVDGARSGRTSFSNPNLQNIPRAGSVEGKMARDCFHAPPGHVLVQADYSQLELRVAAMLSGDPIMIAIFKEGVDYHLRTAMMVAELAWKMPPERIKQEYESTGKSEQRTAAKAINFGVIYGKGDNALAAELGCSKAQAGRVREAIMGKLKVLSKWCDARLDEARRTGAVWTWWDGQPARRRPLIQVADADDKKRSVAEHGSWNTPIQGTASDFCIASLVEVVKWVQDDCVPAKVVLPVHDSIMLEVREDAVDEVLHGLSDIMLQWNSNGVPLTVDLEVGESWGSMKPVSLS